MIEKLKYKVGDKVLIEAEVVNIDDDIDDFPYQLKLKMTRMGWMSSRELEDSIIHLPPKPKVPQAVLDYYLKYRDRDWVFGTWFSFKSMSYEVKNWLYSNKKLNLQRQHALATLIAYGPEAVEVEKEKRYSDGRI